MEKIKNLLSPAHKTDEETMYAEGDNSGKLAGEGSHFGDMKSGSHPAGASTGGALTGGSSNVGSDAASTTALKEGVSGPYSETTTGANSDAVRAAQIATGTTKDDSTSGLPIYKEMTGQQDYSKTASPYSSHGVDPRVDGSQSHSTRNTALGGGLASSAATGYEVDKSNRGPEHETVATAPADTTSSSYPTATGPSAGSSNIGTAVTTGADPTYSSTTSSVPDPETSAPVQTSSIGTTPSAATGSSALPAVTGKTVNEPEHHFGRDAALGTGVGAAGLAAYETGKHHETSTQNTTNTSGATDSGTSGPLGSLRDLINSKTGVGGSSTTDTGASSVPHSATNESSYGGATSVPHSSTNEPSSITDAGATSVPRSTTNEPSSVTGADATSVPHSTTNESSSTGAAGLPVGSIRPLVDEKTNTGTGTQSSLSQLDGSTDPTTTSTRETAANPLTGNNAGAITSNTSETAPSGHHYARDTAIGAAAGAGLVGSYDYLRGDKDTTGRADTTAPSTSGLTSGLTSSTGPSHVSSDTTSRADTTVPSTSGLTSSTGPSHVSSGTDNFGPADTSSTTQPSNFQSTAPIQPVANEEGKEKEHHYGRDAALGAGAAGIGGAAYGHHHHEEDQKAAEKARKEAEKQHEKDIKEAEKQHHKDVKHHEKEVKAAEKQHEKEVKAAEKHHEKDLKAAEKQHHKELKAQDAELAEAERHRHEKEAAFAGVAGAGATGLAVHEHNKKDNLGNASSSITAPSQSSGVAAGDPTQRDRIASIADTRAEGRLQSTDAGAAGATGLGAGGIAAHEHGSDAEPKERKSSILDIFKRHKNDDESHDKHNHGKEAAAGAGIIGTGALGAHEYEKHHGSSTGASTIDPAKSDPSTDFPQSVSEQKVYRDGLGHYKSDPSETSGGPSAPSAGVVRNDLGHMAPTNTSGTGAVAGSTDHSHRGLETAATGAGLAGAGTLGAHEYDKHHRANTAGADVTSNTGVGRTAPATDTSNYTSNTGLGNTTTADTTGRDHHRGLEAAATGAGLAGAGTLGAHEYEKHHQANTTGADVTSNTGVGSTAPATYPSNTGVGNTSTTDNTGVGSTVPSTYTGNTGVGNTTTTDNTDRDHHRGLETAAAGAGVGAIGAHEYNKHHDTTGAAATESQTHPAHGQSAAEPRLGETTNTSHHHHHHHKEEAAAGGLGAAAIAKKENKPATGTTGDLDDSRGLTSGTDGAFNNYDSSKHNKLHKDPPAGHPAALAAAGAGTGIGAETSTAGESNLLHGHHAGSLRDTPDTNVENPRHDPAGMGYDGKTHLNLG